ncbi:MAG: MoxR family ATPase [Fibrobacteria bacterium]|nr:MoxR family ATPase [Fibrobacteria bacterium]
MNENTDFIQQSINNIRQEIGRVIIGQQEAVEKCLIIIFTGGHGLIEGVPGIAKTLLIRTLARLVDVSFNRIQFTPDLMPADIIGTNVFNMQKGAFELVKGPVFTSFLLGDEINRAPAKTQSALLQAMQERRVTIDRHTYELPAFFTVFATQNPVEYEGTYPLPEAQKDRFLLKINMDYPGPEEEMLLAESLSGRQSPEQLLENGDFKQVFSNEILSRIQQYLQDVVIRKEVVQYIVSIVRATRTHESILIGAGPRGTQALLLASRALAVIRGRDFITPDDIKEIAPCALAHRIVLRPEFEIEGLTTVQAIEKVIRKIEVPR